MIRINGTALTPSTFSVNIADVDRVSQNNARGELLRDTVGVKRTLSVSFNALDNDDLQTVLNTLQSGFFDVTYPDPLEGETTRTFYVSAKDVGMYRYDGENTKWQGLSFTFTER